MKLELCCLLVEDDPDDQEFFFETLHTVLPDAGCYAVSNGEEALRILLEENFAPDFIFTDLNMPKMGGLEFLQTIKKIETFKNIPVVVYTADYSQEDVAVTKRLGAAGIFSKTRRNALEEILKRYLIQSPRKSTVH